MNSIFPLLVAFSMLLSGGLYVVTTVKDREDKLRYLLNFTGISSTAYYLGIFAADLILFIVPTSAIMILSLVLQVDTFTQNMWALSLVFMQFALSFIPLSYFVAFLFSKTDTAFKYSRLVALLYSFIVAYPSGKVNPYQNPFVYQSKYILSPIAVFM
jgi:hypothetical protein